MSFVYFDGMERKYGRYILCMTLCLLPLWAIAQEPADFGLLEKRADSLYTARAYDEALDLYMNLQRRYEKWEFSATKIIELQIRIARIYRSKGEYANTLKYLNRAIQKGEEELESDDPLLAKAYNGLGIYFYVQRNPIQALDAFRKSYDIRLLAFGPEDPLVADALNNLAICYQQMEAYDQALNSYEESLDIRINHFGDCHNSVADAYLNIGVTWHRLGDLRKALDYYDRSRVIYVTDLETYGSSLVSVLNNMGVCYQDLGDYASAEILLQQALATNQGLYEPDHPEVAFSLNNLGLNYFNLGDYNKALLFFRQALDIREQSLEPGHPLIARLWNHMASCYLKKKDYEQAYQLANMALEMRLDRLGRLNTDVADSYSDLGLYFETVDQLDDAEENYQEALSIYREQLGDDHPLVGDINLRLGSCYYRQGKKLKALRTFREALRIRELVLGKSHPETARVLAQMALCKESDPEEGLAILAPALTIVEDLETNSGQEVHAQIALEVLIARSTLLQNMQTEEWIAERQTAIQEVHDSGLSWMDSALRSFQEPGSKQLLLDRFYRLLEMDIENCAEGFDQTGDALWLRRAFMTSERGKGLLLREAAARVQAESFADLPDSLLQKEQGLLLDIAALERRIFQANDSLQEALRPELFSLKQMQYDLLRSFKEEYPEYYQLRYAVQKVDTDLLARYADQHDLNILEYFQGDRSSYIILLNADTIFLHRIGSSKELVALVANFRNQLTSYSPMGNSGESFPEEYVQTAYELYNLLIEPVEEQLLGNRLLIVPDGVLHYLPFDCLIGQPVGAGSGWKTLPFLLRDFSVGYAYTTDLLMRDTYLQRADRDEMLALAPSFPEGGNLPPLLYNLEEVNTVSTRWPSKVLEGQEANKQEFLKIAPKYRVLHLATHAHANDTLGRYSYLAFQEDTIDPDRGRLYARELYNLRLPADLVVLSACETGVGEWQRGEGMISLARGFFYAGSRSLLTSLWKLDDRSSAQLMADFYSNLLEGMPKDVALQQAKLDFIRTNSSVRAHPFFWASFVPVGIMEPVEPPRSNNWLWWGAGGLLLVLTFGFYAVRKR